MTKKNRAALALALLGSAWMSAAHAADAATETTNAQETEETYEIDIHVTGAKERVAGGMVGTAVRMGIMGDVDVLDVPYSMQSMTEKAVTTYGDPSQPLAHVLINNPSIRTSTSSPMYSDFSMRGINMNGNHFLLNGVPSLFSQFSMPRAHFIDRMDISAGPNAAVNGVSMSNNGTNSGATPAPGTINIVTKRAEKEPITKYTQVFSGRSTMAEYIDIGRRFGKDNEWGIRINAELLDGGLSLPGGKTTSRDIFVNLDRMTERSMTNLFFGYWDYNVMGAQRWFTYNGNRDALPTAPDAKTSYDFPETWKKIYVKLLTLNHEQKLNDRWSAFFNMGYAYRDGDKRNSGANLQFDADGNFTSSNRANAQNESAKNSYFQLGIAGTFDTGAVRHRLVLATDRSRSQYWNAGKTGPTGLYGGNLYDSIIFRSGFYPLPAMPAQIAQWTETNAGVSLMDTMTLGKWSLLLAATRKHEDLKNHTNNTTIRNNNILPTWGLTYKPTDNTAVYYGHTESFSRGYVVTNAKYVNAGDVMPPVRSKQNEIGIKYENKGLRSTLALFEIDEANRFDVDLGGGKYQYTADGKNIYRGIELTVNGQIAPRLTMTGGLLHLHAKRDKTQGGAKDGCFVNGVARWSTVLGLNYAVTESVSVLSRVNWVDKSYIDSKAAGKRTEIPSYATLDLGLRYQTKYRGLPVELQLMCYNATNRSHWMGRGGSTTFGLSMPRTFMFSASIDL